MYNWQHKEWANFTFNPQIINDTAVAFLKDLTLMDGLLEGLSSREQQEEIIRIMIDEATKTSEIEGEYISREDLMSSIKRKLGLDSTAYVRDKRAAQVANMMYAVRNSFQQKLTETEIRKWHRLLFESSKHINAGKWRTSDEPMQVVSGAFGREIVHYEAPPSYRVPAEMKQFVKWYNAYKTNDEQDVLIKTAIAHLYFESIHPFEDGNGRIGRAIAEKCLAQGLKRTVLLSLSSTIERDKKSYYKAFKNNQNTLEITDWIVYFSGIIAQAQADAVHTVKLSISKTRFFDAFQDKLNERQTKVLKKMFDNGGEDFEGGMTAKKYVSIAKTTKTTATRDLQELVALDVFVRKGDGRSTYYVLKLS